MDEESVALVPVEEIEERIAFRYDPPRDGPRRLIRVANELAVHDAVIIGEAFKTRRGLVAVERIDRQLITAMGHVADHAYETRSRLRYPGSVELFDQLIAPGLPHMGQQLYGIVNAGVYNIGTVVARSIYPTAERRGFSLRDFVLGPPADED